MTSTRRNKNQDPVFNPYGFVNVDQLEFVEQVPTGGTHHRKSSKGKRDTRKVRAKTNIGELAVKMDMLLRRQEEHKRETREAFHFLYRNQVQMAEEELYTHKGTLPLYFIEPHPTGPADVPSSCRKGKDQIVIPDSKDEDEEMEDGEEHLHNGLAPPQPQLFLFNKNRNYPQGYRDAKTNQHQTAIDPQVAAMTGRTEAILGKDRVEDDADKQKENSHKGQEEPKLFTQKESATTDGGRMNEEGVRTKEMEAQLEASKEEERELWGVALEEPIIELNDGTSTLLLEIEDDVDSLETSFIDPLCVEYLGLMFAGETMKEVVESTRLPANKKTRSSRARKRKKPKFWERKKKKKSGLLARKRLTCQKQRKLWKLTIPRQILWTTNPSTWSG
ncbi:uncharacterized protein G2W53_000969 [Senna tora]|uniref:Uncharacterized protein n=1 Tax=Senna tora TaxID=362788 RepID=A0A835CJ03_9FABA|nr:uncharacterized protein G2W53_000969 [Senna tora]